MSRHSNDTIYDWTGHFIRVNYAVQLLANCFVELIVSIFHSITARISQAISSFN